MSILSKMLGQGRTQHVLEQPLNPNDEGITREILDKLFGEHLPIGIGFRLWNGALWPSTGKEYWTLIVLNRPSALREMLAENSESSLGMAFLEGAFDITGNIEAAFILGNQLVQRTGGWVQKLDVAHLLRKLPKLSQPTPKYVGKAHLNGSLHSEMRDRDAISFHYNVSNEFYALWLGTQMAYSCAYFREPDDSLEEAQDHKFEYICRKLDLQREDALLDVGCGWGGLILYAAKVYGVRATGITLSREQLQLARERIQQAGLSDRVSVYLQDYRKLREEPIYNAVASVGMVEHVGRGNLQAYFRKIHSVLKPGGLFLNHGIGIGPAGCPGRTGSFIQNYVFPDSDVLAIGEMTCAAEKEGWAVRDIENLRLHYTRTLREWVKRLEIHEPDAIQIVGARAYRTWRLYMAGSAYNFQIGRLAIYQSLLAKLDPMGGFRGPLLRSTWYG